MELPPQNFQLTDNTPLSAVASAKVLRASGLYPGMIAGGNWSSLLGHATEDPIHEELALVGRKRDAVCRRHAAVEDFIAHLGAPRDDVGIRVERPRSGGIVRGVADVTILVENGFNVLKLGRGFGASRGRRHGAALLPQL